MSGIAGIVRLDGQPVDSETVSAMAAALGHRGPDGCGIWIGGTVGLAHQALRVTPSSRHEQWPLVDRTGALVLVADARIDNREELARSLGLRCDDALTDAALILIAYERWGDGCAKELVGDFAFAIWDARRHRLFCARDAMGVKPFYYFSSRRVFVFASEVKALLRLPEVPREPDGEQIAAFLEWRHDDPVRTLYRGIDRLAAAHTLSAGSGSVAQRRYWQLDPEREIRLANADEYAAAFRELFTEAVRCRTRSAHPVGSTLSGGLDSSSIACTARELLAASGAPALHTFSLVFPSLSDEELRLIDERPYVDAVVDGGGIVPHFVRGDRVSPLKDMPRMLWHLDEPYFAPNLYLHWAMLGAARASGARVFLDGMDGDATVGHGFGRLTTLADSGQWDTLEAEVRAFARHRARDASYMANVHVLPYLGQMARQGRPAAWARAAFELRRRFRLPRRELLVANGLRPFAEGRRSAAARRPEATDREAQVEALGRPVYQLALEMVDKSAAAFGIEPRYPFFDRRLMEFSVSVPGEQRFADGWPRMLLRRAMAGVLPEVVRWRSDKANLSPNFHRRLRTAHRDLVRASLSEPLGSYTEVDRLRRVADRYFATEDRQSDAADGPLLFRATTLAAWLTARDAEVDDGFTPMTAAEGMNARRAEGRPRMGVSAAIT